MKFINAVLALCLSAVALGDKCCERCPAGKEKFFSIDGKYDRCGECCMNPKNFWLFKKFEKTLQKAEVENPCFQLGYTQYETTETHGALTIKMTLDKFAKPEQSIEQSQIVQPVEPQQFEEFEQYEQPIEPQQPQQPQQYEQYQYKQY